MPDDNRLSTVYQQLCSSYHEIDSFRAQLLGRLPLATGAGIGLLYVTNGSLSDETKGFLPAIGLFGFVVTLGLFAYEIYGIKKCHALIGGGRQMEHELGIDGQFSRRPRSVLGIINEPFAAGVIYPAVLAAWTYVAVVFVDWLKGSGWWIAGLVFLAFFALSLGYNLWLKSDGKLVDLALLNQDILRAEEDGIPESLEPLLAPGFTIVRSNGVIQDRQTFLDQVPHNMEHGRLADQVDVRRYGQHAVFTCRVTTTRNKAGHDVVRRFWNTRLFIQKREHDDKHWLCTSWQVMEICAAVALPASEGG